ncbi:hypothetical protein U2F10_35955 [Leptothoe sp. EHU-05/26/07-4]
MSDIPTIWVAVETALSSEDTTTEGERSGHVDIGPRFGASEPEIRETEHVVNRQRIPLDVKLLKEQMSGLLTVVNDLFVQAAQQSEMKLDELELSVEVDGEGKVNLIGNGVRLGSSGGITMKFKSK